MFSSNFKVFPTLSKCLWILIDYRLFYEIGGKKELVASFLRNSESQNNLSRGEININEIYMSQKSERSRQKSDLIMKNQIQQMG